MSFLCRLGMHDWREEWRASWEEYAEAMRGDRREGEPPLPPRMPPPGIQGGEIVGRVIEQCRRCSLLNERDVIRKNRDVRQERIQRDLDAVRGKRR